jgi:Family of unknown function (DUF6444)
VSAQGFLRVAGNLAFVRRAEIDAIYRAGPDAVAAVPAAQAEGIAALEAELEELKRLMIGRNSNNSGLPQSRDSREVREQRSKQRSSGKKQGGQPGHKGRQRKLVAHPDHTGQRCAGDAATRSPRALCTSVPRYGSSSAGRHRPRAEGRPETDIGSQASRARDARATTNAGLDWEDVAGLANRQKQARHRPETRRMLGTISKRVARQAPHARFRQAKR